VFVRFYRPNVLTGSLPPKLLFACARCFVRVSEGRKRNKNIFTMVRVFFQGEFVQPDRAKTEEWWAWVDLNHRPRPYQGRALAT
jgi:hypothetical protein